jgi:hypothetical protein
MTRTTLVRKEQTRKTIDSKPMKRWKKPILLLVQLRCGGKVDGAKAVVEVGIESTGGGKVGRSRVEERHQSCPQSKEEASISAIDDRSEGSAFKEL